MKPLLECINVSRYFGAFAAVKNLSFQVFPGEIYGIAGPNGAGKTTLFNSITGIPFAVTSGKVMLDSKEIQNMKAHQICHAGIARTFQIPHVFEDFTYLDNVMVGSLFQTRIKADKTAQRRRVRNGPSPRESAIDALRTVDLLEKRDASARGASLFDIKRLMVASALATRPRLLLLDEPVGGLNRSEIEHLLDLIRKVNSEGVTTVIIEHIMTALMTISNRVMILQSGEKICEGTPEEVGSDEAAIEAYLGKEYRVLIE